MSDKHLLLLAREAGILTRWTDAFGRKRSIAPDTIRTILDALGLPCHNAAATNDSIRQVQESRSRMPSLVVCTPGEKMELGARARTGRLVLEDGSKQDLRFHQAPSGQAYANVPTAPGYHTLEFGRQQVRIAVAPRRLSMPGAMSKWPWGLVAQIYSLPGGGTPEFGDFAALGELCERAGKGGAAAVGMSPVHALLPWALKNYSPYAPSSRRFLNPLFASLSPIKGSAGTSGLIDWAAAYPAKMVALRAAYHEFTQGSAQREDFRQFVDQGGDRLLCHARFEVLHGRFSAGGKTRWRDWPEEFRNSDSASVLDMLAAHPEIEFHLYLQWLAEKSLREAQDRAKRAGMQIGLIADLAIGIDPNGSDAWSDQSEVLSGLTIGAPPDQLGPEGQNWGLTSFSPRALQASSFHTYIATLRAVLRSTGGVRIDHAMGFRRLWVIPEGAPSECGAYLLYPFKDLLSLAVLEASRRNAVVIAEDLGTVPRGFRTQLAKRGFSGMRVLWFERDQKGGFVSSHAWSRHACAMTSTHDLPTVAGWWRGRDIAWRARLSRSPKGKGAKKVAAVANNEREADRKRLWKALNKDKCVSGSRPARGETGVVVEGVLRFVARSNCDIALFPLEDVVGVVEQPNIPGTVDVHPNWRARLSSSILDSERVMNRFAMVTANRNGMRAASGRPSSKSSIKKVAKR